MCWSRTAGSSRSLNRVTSRPAILTLPLVGRRMQPMMETSVVLPLPEGPISRVSFARVDVQIHSVEGARCRGAFGVSFGQFAYFDGWVHRLWLLPSIP